MLRGLRLRLTILYLLVALGLVAAVGGGTYFFLNLYFKRITDLALQHKMAYQFRVLGIDLPPELKAADQTWYGTRNANLAVTPTTDKNSGEGYDEDDDNDAGQPLYELDDAYDAELASIFVFPVDQDGRLVFDPNSFTPPVLPNLDGIHNASKNGLDWRTVYEPNGTAVRLLTYTLPPMDGPAMLQMGRALGDQQRILHQLLLGLLGFNALSILVLGYGSWLIAGRSLVPAQKAWEQQQVFVANASHELRAPLTLIQASTEVALRKEADEEKKGLLVDVLRECDHMGRLVEDLLLLSRLDSHRLKMENREITISELFSDLQRMAVRLGLKRQTEVVFSACECKVLADPTRLRQVLLILIDNALRHNPTGGEIKVDAATRGKYVSISVSDKGKGIPPEHQKHVFERFYQEESSRSGSDRGSGLGLPIAKALITAQGGTIALTSKVGEGTTVTITIPRMETPHRKKPVGKPG
jgi:signal transduction histidine kinase